MYVWDEAEERGTAIINSDEDITFRIQSLNESQIRELVSRDELIDDLVSAKVVEYIRSKSLYRV